jgi:hypothetical protein
MNSLRKKFARQLRNNKKFYFIMKAILVNIGGSLSLIFLA